MLWRETTMTQIDETTSLGRLRPARGDRATAAASWSGGDAMATSGEDRPREPHFSTPWPAQGEDAYDTPGSSTLEASFFIVTERIIFSAASDLGTTILDPGGSSRDRVALRYVATERDFCEGEESSVVNLLMTLIISYRILLC